MIIMSVNNDNYYGVCIHSVLTVWLKFQYVMTDIDVHCASNKHVPMGQLLY